MLNLLLLAGKLLFLLVLYSFIFLVMRSALRDVRLAGTRSTRATPVPAAPEAAGVWTLAVERSPDLRVGDVYSVSAAPLEVGRSSVTGLQLHDTFVSSHHARFTPLEQGLLLEDLDSTNGTYVNGEAAGSRWLQAGDHVAVGDTVFRVGVT